MSYTQKIHYKLIKVSPIIDNIVLVLDCFAF